jgi:protein phosphatase
MPQMSMHGSTHIGLVRKNNEDGFSLLADLNTAIVADGMGGAACGEVASSVCLKSMEQVLRSGQDGADRGSLLTEAIRFANFQVRLEAQGRTDCKGMGSTVVAACWNDSRIKIDNVGDSRAYKWRGGSLTQLSYDQNVGNELRHNLGLTESQVLNYPQRNALTMAIGSGSDLKVESHEETLEAGDIFVLCSDGLSGPAGENKLSEILRGGGDLKVMTESMTQAALHAGGPDNITVILLRWN